MELTKEQELEIRKWEAKVDYWIVKQLHEMWKRGCGHNAETIIVYGMEICDYCNRCCPS